MSLIKMVQEELRRATGAICDQVAASVSEAFMVAAARGDTAPELVDLDAEGEVLSALLNELTEAPTSLQEYHFYSTTNARIYRQLKAGLGAEQIIENAIEAGMTSGVRRYVEGLRDGTPFVDLKRLARQASRLMDLYESREAIHRLRKTEALIRAGRMDGRDVPALPTG